MKLIFIRTEAGEPWPGEWFERWTESIRIQVSYIEVKKLRAWFHRWVFK